MSKLAVGLSCGVAIVGAGVIFLQRQTNDELRGEIALLREDVQRLAAVRPAPAHDSSSPVAFAPATGSGAGEAEVAQLREDVAALKKDAEKFAKLAQTVQAAAAAAKTESSQPVNLTPTSGLKNAGRGTPNAAVETVIWAAAGGEVDAVADSLAFLPTARDKANAMFAQLSPATQAQYGSPEKLLALLIAKDAAALSGMQILGQRDIAGPDNVGVRVRLANDQGQTKEAGYLLNRGTDGTWRMMLTDEAVEKYAKQVLGGGGSAQTIGKK